MAIAGKHVVSKTKLMGSKVIQGTKGVLDDTITRAKDLTDKGKRILKGDLTDIKQYFGEIKTAYSNNNKILIGYMQDTNGGMHPVHRMDFDSGGGGKGTREAEAVANAIGNVLDGPHTGENMAMQEMATRVMAELEPNLYSMDVGTNVLPNDKMGYEYLDDQLGSLKDKVDIKEYQSAESANEWWMQKGYGNPPYTEKTVIQDIELKEDCKFVRVYDGENSKLQGGWVMMEEDIKGLSPAEIQDKYALPTTPSLVGEVNLDACIFRLVSSTCTDTQTQSHGE